MRESRRVSGAWIGAVIVALALATAACGGAEHAPPASTTAPRPSQPTPGDHASPSAARTAPLAIAVGQVGPCSEVAIPEEGAIPHVDDMTFAGDVASIALHIANADGACPDAPTFTVERDGDALLVTIAHHSPVAHGLRYQALYRDIDARVTGVAPGALTIMVRSAEAPDAGRPTYHVTVR